MLRNRIDEGQELLGLNAVNALMEKPETVTLEDALAHYLDHPVDWVDDIIGINLDPWQRSLMEGLVDKRFVSVRSGHGVGKSCILSITILWFLSTHPNCKIICTAPTKEQLYDVLWAECHKWIRESAKLAQIIEWTQDRIYVKSNPQEWFAVARTAEVRKLGKTGLAVAEAMQGRHAESVLYVLDEASGIDESIMETVDGTLTGDDCYVLMAGNPTRPSGTFYDSFHTRRHLWHTLHVSSEDTPTASNPRVGHPWLKRMLDKFGSRDHPMYLIRVRGEFPPGQPNSLYPLNIIEESIALDLQPTQFDYYELGVDVARYGGDETAICVRHGPVIERIDTYSHQTTMEVAGRVVQYINKYRPLAVKIDAIGVGAGVYDRLHELNYREVIAINSGSEAADKKLFFNLRAEAHWNLRMLLEQKKLKLPKGDDDLIAQMTSITHSPNSKGKTIVESKEQLRARGVKSPDRLDALVLATMPATPVVHRATFGSFAFMGR